MRKIFEIIRTAEPEALIWLTGLLFLAVIPVEGSNHFTLCPLKNLGLNYCPGCGLGSSIHYIFHLEFYKAILTHPLGPAALVILLYRIFSLSKLSYLNYRLACTKQVNNNEF